MDAGTASARPAKPRSVKATAHERVYAELSQSLMNGDFVPGQRLVVRKIAERFETSAMPVREALRRLVSDEALYDHPNRGVIVPEATVASITDLLRVRRAVEGKAAEWAAGTITEAELDEITALNARMGESTAAGGYDGYFALNRRFHFAVYSAARSPVLSDVIEKLWLRAGPWLTLVRSTGTVAYGLHHHTALIDGLRRGDAVAAREALVADLTDAADIILRAAAAPPEPAGSRRTARSGTGAGTGAIR